MFDEDEIPEMENDEPDEALPGTMVPVETAAIDEPAIDAPIEDGMAFIRQLAMQPDMSVEKLSQILDVQERYRKIEAEKAFTEAMVAFKQDPPIIVKTTDGDKHKYASLAQVVALVLPALAKYGFTHRWLTEQQGGEVKVTCILTHVQGHSISASFTGPHDTTGSKNAAQAVGSAFTYGERYSLMAVTGLAAHEMDDDGASSGAAPARQQGKGGRPAAARSSGSQRGAARSSAPASQAGRPSCPEHGSQFVRQGKNGHWYCAKQLGVDDAGKKTWCQQQPVQGGRPGAPPSREDEEPTFVDRLRARMNEHSVSSAHIYKVLGVTSLNEDEVEKCVLGWAIGQNIPEADAILNVVNEAVAIRDEEAGLEERDDPDLPADAPAEEES